MNKDNISDTKQGFELVKGGEKSECLRCNYVGCDHAENAIYEHKDGESEVFCPVCHSTHLYIIESY